MQPSYNTSETPRILADRINNHLSCIRTGKNTPIGLHFNTPEHILQHFSIMVVERINNKNDTMATMLFTERTWQNLLQIAHSKQQPKASLLHGWDNSSIFTFVFIKSNPNPNRMDWTIIHTVHTEIDFDYCPCVRVIEWCFPNFLSSHFVSLFVCFLTAHQHRKAISARNTIVLIKINRLLYYDSKFKET